MRNSRYPFSAMTALVLLLPMASPGLAQKPLWTPVAELLVGSLAESDPARMSDVMTRCTALNLILAGMNSDVSATTAQLYKNEALRMMQHAVLIESQIEKGMTGQTADIPSLSNTAIAKVEDTLKGYNEWLDENIEAEGSYFNKEIDTEIDSCQLASKLANQVLME